MVQGTNGTICVHIAVIDRSVEVDLRRIERIVVPGVDRTRFACLLALQLKVSYEFGCLRPVTRNTIREGPMFGLA